MDEVLGISPQLSHSGRPAWRERIAAYLALVQLARTQSRLLSLTLCASVLSQAGIIGSLALGAWLTGLACAGQAPEPLYLAALAATVIAGALARWWQADVSHRLAFALIETLQVGIYSGLERAAPLPGTRSGDLASIATQDAQTMEHFFAHFLGDLLAAVLLPLFALLLLALIDPLLALAWLPLLPLLASVPLWLGWRAEVQGRQLAAVQSRLNADVAEGLQGRKEFAVFGQEDRWLHKLASNVQSLQTAQKKYAARAGLEQAAIELLQAGAVVLVALAAGHLVLNLSVPPALLPLVLVLAATAAVPLAELAQSARKLGELKAAAQRILHVLELPERIPDTGHATPGNATLNFRQVGFSYAERQVLQGVDFQLRPGEIVALVGASGVGKSTCGKLMLRFFDVQAGQICIGDTDIRDLSLAALRQTVAYVPQDVYLFEDSVANNIRLGRPDASMADVERVARLAQAHDFICRLPQGYDTPCGVRASRLSGGQAQRIAIARALLQQAPILVLDEATSHIDTVGELALHKALDTLRAGHGILLIAHRPSTIRQADRILVLEHGRIVEQGNHAELLARQGAYARLLSNEST